MDARTDAQIVVGLRAACSRLLTLQAHHSPRFAAILLLGLALLIAGCVRLTYDETATPSPDVVPSPISAPTATGTISPAPAGPQDEAAQPTPAIQGPPMLRLDPSVVNLTIGETREVQVRLDNAEGLHSIELYIGFEPGYVSIEDADPTTEGVQISAGVIPRPAQVMRNEVDHTAGLVIYHVAQVPGEPVSGSGVVASFMVRALAEGGSPLTFSAANLRDPDGQPLPPPEQVAGLVIIGPGGTMAGPTAVAATTTPAPDSPASTTSTYHTVQPGENLFRIALRYGTTVDAIVAANGLPDENAIQAGQVLLIPVGAPTGTTTYVVQPGDTLYSIARRFDTTVDTLAALNGISPPYTIEVGQVLIVAP